VDTKIFPMQHSDGQSLFQGSLVGAYITSGVTKKMTIYSKENSLILRGRDKPLQATLAVCGKLYLH